MKKDLRSASEQDLKEVELASSGWRPCLSEVLALFREHELNREWFARNRERLVERYDDKFVAI